MYFQNLLAAANVWQTHHHLTVETAGAQQSGIEHIGAVGRRNDDDAVIHFKPVHLHQQLVQRLLTLIVTTAHTGATVPTHGIDLVDEDNAGRLLFGLFEHIPNTGGTDPHKHFHEIRTRDREERHFGLTRNGLGEQGFTGSRRPHHQHAAGNTTAESLEFAGVAQKLYQFLHIFFRFIHTRHIGKGGFDLVFTEQASLAFTKRHRAAFAAPSAALHLAHEEHENGEDDQNGEAGYQQLRPKTLLFWLAAFNDHIVLQQVIDQLGIIQQRANRLETTAVAALATDDQAIDDDFAHTLVLHFCNELGIVELLSGRLHAEIVENCQQHRSDHQPQQKVFCHIVQEPILYSACGAPQCCGAQH